MSSHSGLYLLVSTNMIIENTGYGIMLECHAINKAQMKTLSNIEPGPEPLVQHYLGLLRCTWLGVLDTDTVYLLLQVCVLCI